MIERHLKRGTWFLAALGAFLAAPRPWAAPVTPQTVDEIALVVDQDAMTKGEMEEAVATIFQTQGLEVPKPGTPDYEQAKKEVTEAFVREVLLAEEADRDKVEISDGEVDHQVDQEISSMRKRFSSDAEFDEGLKKEGINQDDLRQYIHDQIYRRLKAQRALQLKQHDLPASVFVTDEEVKKYFAEHPGDYAQAKFSIILFRISSKSTPAYVAEVNKQAKDLLAKLKAGGDFAEAAKKYSEDTDSAEKGGDVGTHYRADLDSQLAAGIFAIPAHSVGMVKTKDGLYLVKVDRKSAANYEAVAQDIQEHLRRQKQDSAFNEWLDGLKKSAYIVEDGKVVAFQETPKAQPTAVPVAAASTPVPETTAASSTPVASAQAAPASAAATQASKAPKELYPTLPPGGGFAIEVGGLGFSYGSQDLAAYYPVTVDTNQSFPFGIGLHLGVDFSIDPTLQVGLSAQGLTKFGESVNFTGYSDDWSAAAVGGGPTARLLIPLDESTNFLLKAGGGYYFLTGSSVTISGTINNSPVTEDASFSGSNFGGQVGGGIEFFLDESKNSTLEVDAGYRFLKFTPISSNPIINANGPIPTSSLQSPLLNSDGSQAGIDFSGPYLGVGFRFYLDKEGS